MKTPTPNTGSPTLAHIGATLAGIALFIPALTVPACLAFVAIIGGASLLRSDPLEVLIPAPAPRKAARRRRDRVTTASEDSFPASDPPAWTGVTGPGTKH